MSLLLLQYVFLGFEQEKRTKSQDEGLFDLVEPDDLVHYGLIPELNGRLHVTAKLAPITKDDMVRILTEPKMVILEKRSKVSSLLMKLTKLRV